MQDFKLLKVKRHFIKVPTLPANMATHSTWLGARYLFNGFKFLGIYMPEKNRALYILWSLIINSLVTLYLPVAFMISFLQLSSKEIDLGQLLTSAQVAINVLGCSLKIIIMYFLLPKLLKTKTLIQKLDDRCNSLDELTIIRQFIRRGNRYVVLFAISYWSYSSSTCISAILFGHLPYNIYNPLLDYRQSTYHYIMALIIEMTCMNIACFQQVVDDSYAVIYVNILRLHNHLLLKRIERISSYTDYNTKQHVTPSDRFKELKLCIMDHKNIIELYNIVASVISVTIFIQFTITATILGTTLINILLFASNIASIVASCFYVLAVVVEIFPLCYYAQCFMDESNRLAETIFHSNWMEQQRNYRQLLIVFIQKSQYPLEFTAGKIFPITLNSFINIAKFSFSLYTFIKEMNIKERFGLA